MTRHAQKTKGQRSTSAANPRTASKPAKNRLKRLKQAVPAFTARAEVCVSLPFRVDWVVLAILAMLLRLPRLVFWVGKCLCLF